MNTTTDTRTVQQRWTAALDTIREGGVRVRQNVRKCCRGCIVEADLGMDEGSTQPYAYTYGGQGSAIYWEDGQPVVRTRGKDWYGRPNTEATTDAYWNHGNGSGQVVADAFTAQGFEVDYDGTEARCVVVKFPKAA